MQRHELDDDDGESFGAEILDSAAEPVYFGMDVGSQPSFCCEIHFDTDGGIVFVGDVGRDPIRGLELQ